MFSASVHTRVSKILEILEDGVELRSLLRLPVPTPFGDLPHRRGHSWGFKEMRFQWSPTCRDPTDDDVFIDPSIWHPSGRELEMKRSESEPGNITLSENQRASTINIDKEYTSDLFVGCFFSTLAALSILRRSGTSSGALYGSAQLWAGAERFRELMCSVIGQRPKSERQELPSASMRMFD